MSTQSADTELKSSCLCFTAH